MCINMNIYIYVCVNIYAHLTTANWGSPFEIAQVILQSCSVVFFWISNVAVSMVAFQRRSRRPAQRHDEAKPGQGSWGGTGLTSDYTPEN